MLFEIEGYQRRTEDLDAHLAHYVAHLLSPHRGKKPPVAPEKLRRFKPRETETEEVPVEDLIEERRNYFTEHLASVGAPI